MEKIEKQIKFKYNKKDFCIEVSKFLYELSVICLDKVPHTNSGDIALSDYIVQNVYIESENFNRYVIDSLIDLVADESLIEELVKWELKMKECKVT